ncbi:unnamed protein product [Bursaphelenchus okinawaensis]|uniref:Uncharacterized protein n=1 Tax=Bursaphelenchus okinawaensis TaxID=465554 RepID=A0A811JPT4_9BILA|nr:unnamed protein product [Bursaphelenchus okinawaensis]CAG9077009.1 unnamed protein product [Bursaphelenchus okinawaensis]
MLFPTAMPQNMPMVQSSSQQQLSNIPATLALLQHHQQLQHQQQLQQQKVANPMQKQPFFNELQHLLQQEVHRQHFQQLLELQQKQQMIAAAVQSSTASTVSGGAIGQMRANLLTPDHLEENKFHGNDTTDSRNHWMSPPVAPLTPASSGSPIQCHIEEAKATSSDRDTGFSDGSSMEAETPPPKVFNSAERLGLGTERLGLGTERLGLGTERLGFGAERLGLTGTDRMNLTNPDVNEKQSFEALKLSETVRTLEALKQSSEALKPSETLKTLESQKQPQKSSEAAELLDLTKAKKSEKKAKKRLATTPRKVSPKKAKVMEMLLNGSRDQLPKKFRDLTESEGIAVAVLAGLAGGR